MNSQKIKNDAIFGIVRLLLALTRIVPRPLGLALFGAVGRCLYLLPLREKQLTIEHLRMIYATHHTEAWIVRTACSVYENIGRNAFDAVWLSRAGSRQFNRWVRYDQAEFNRVKTAHALGKGIVFITAHIGCFELLLQFIGRQGIPAFAVGQRLYDARLDELVRNLRSGPNIAYVHRDGSAREIIRFLGQGRGFGVLVDQDTNVESIFAPFLGIPAYTPSAPVKLAQRYAIPTFVITTARQPDNTHRIFIEGPLTFERSSNDLAEGVAQVNSALSAMIRRFPEQWVWMHRRWNRRPDDPAYSHIVNADTIGNGQKKT